MEKTSSVPSASPKKSKAFAALAINALMVTAGLGTILGGRTKQGLMQVLLVIAGGSLAVFGFRNMLASQLLGMLFVTVGVLMVLSGWVWSLITGMLLVREASATS